MTIDYSYGTQIVVIKKIFLQATVITLIGEAGSAIQNKFPKIYTLKHFNSDIRSYE